MGVNLNRFYSDPSPDLHPTIFATKRAIVAENNINNLQMYCDFHAHPVRKGCFIFGNTTDDKDM